MKIKMTYRGSVKYNDEYWYKCKDGEDTDNFWNYDLDNQKDQTVEYLDGDYYKVYNDYNYYEFFTDCVTDNGDKINLIINTFSKEIDDFYLKDGDIIEFECKDATLEDLKISFNNECKYDKRDKYYQLVLDKKLYTTRQHIKIKGYVKGSAKIIGNEMTDTYNKLYRYHKLLKYSPDACKNHTKEIMKKFNLN